MYSARYFRRSLLRNSVRLVRLQLHYSKEVSSRILVPPASHLRNSRIGGTEIRDNDIDRKGNRITHEYRQLPEDSNYIEAYYNELQLFLDDYLKKELGKTYVDFEKEPAELVFQLEKYIELRVVPRYNHNKPSEKVVIDRFLAFSNGVKLTLRLNGGHTFIFDVMLQAKRVFDKLDAKKNKS
ncbi:hypothetical protein RNJ44_02044 [Nakaseomyces bracarensis]|uniref:Uncharacterized protein n=1 Tax=Nakaseomyces bracarensis TaxID=273131 RepID=A0ABR4NMD9_9SACH